MNELAEEVALVLTRSVDALVNKDVLVESDLLLLEVSLHAAKCKALLKDHLPRPAEVQPIIEYIRKGRHNQPLIVHGPPGVGKTGVIAQAIEQAGAWLKETKGVLMYRFVGHTLFSKDIRALLASLCHQICRTYGQSEASAPEAHKDLVKKLPELFTFVTASRPLVIVLDGLEALGLSSAHMRWLPKTLPDCVRIIVSVDRTQSGQHPYFESLSHRHVEKDSYHEVKSLNPEDGVQLVTNLLTAAKRTVTPKQMLIFRKGFTKATTPIYAYCAFQRMRTWTSDNFASYLRTSRDYGTMGADGGATTLHVQQVMPSTLDDLLGAFFKSLEEVHGAVLVSHALGYLTCVLDGLSDSEMEDILSLDDDVLAEVFPPSWTPPVLRIPPMAWVSLRNSLAGLLEERRVGSDLLRVWCHHEVARVVHNRYVLRQAGGKEVASSVLPERCALLIDYFSGTWSAEPKPITLHGKQLSALRHVPVQPVAYERVAQARNVTSLSRPRAEVQLNTRKLRELPHLMIKAGRSQELAENNLLTVEWIVAKAAALSVFDVYKDFDDVEQALDGDEVVRLSFRFVRQALSLAYDLAAKKGAHQIAGQLVARLQPFANDEFPLVQRLSRDAVEAWHGSTSQLRLQGGASIIPQSEWVCLPVSGNPQDLTMFGHDVPPNCVCVTLDNLWGVSGAHDGDVRVWDLKNGQELLKFKAPTSVTALTTSQDGKTVFAGLVDGNMHAWDLIDEMSIYAVRLHSKEVTSMRVTPGGKLLSTSIDGTLKIRRLNLQVKAARRISTRDVTCTSKAGPLLSQGVAPNEEYVLIGGRSGALEKWGINGAKLELSIQGLPSPVYAIQVTPDNASAWVATENAHICRYDMASGATLQTYDGFNEYFVCVDFSVDAEFCIASVPDGAMAKIDLESGEPMATFWGQSFVECLKLSPNGETALTGTKDKTVVSWNVVMPMNTVGFQGHAAPIAYMAVNPSNGNGVATNSPEAPGTCYVWNLTEPKASVYAQYNHDGEM